MASTNYRTGRVIGLASTAALGGFLFGFDSAVINGAASGIKATFALSSFALGLVVSIALIGSAIGAWFAGYLAERFGRRRVMLVAAALFLLSAFGQAFPLGVYDLCLWRLIGGAGIGVASVMAPMYIAEIAPAQLRGRMGSLQQFAIVIGIFSTGLTNYLILGAAGSDSLNEWLFGIPAWRWMFLTMVIPALVYGYFAWRLPESPRYLVEIGKYDEAATVLSQIYTDDVTARVEDIRVSMQGEHKPRMSDLRGKRFGLMPLVWIGIILSSLQQFVGINAVFYYSNTIWEAVGFSEGQAFQTSLITTGVNVAFTLVAIALVDKVGRKPLLLVGSFGMVAMLGTLTFVFGTAQSAATASRSSPTAPTSSRSSRSTSTWHSSPRLGVRWSGCCSGRCSRIEFGRPLWPWLPPRSGSQTSWSRPPSRHSPTSVWGLLTACSPSLRSSPFGSSSGTYMRPRVSSWKIWPNWKPDSRKPDALTPREWRSWARAGEWGHHVADPDRHRCVDSRCRPRWRGSSGLGGPRRT